MRWGSTPTGRGPDAAADTEHGEAPMRRGPIRGAGPRCGEASTQLQVALFGGFKRGQAAAPLGHFAESASSSLTACSSRIA